MKENKKFQKKVDKTVEWAEKQQAKAGGPEAASSSAPTPAEPFTNEPTKMGRPPKYEFEITNNKAKFLASKGFTDIEMCQALGICESTITNWKKQYPDFLVSIKEGKELIDTMVEKSLLNRAMGCSIKETKAFCYEGVVVTEEIDKHLAPDVTAQIFWLKNRKPGVWRDKHEVDFTNPLTINMSPEDQKTL